MDDARTRRLLAVGVNLTVDAVAAEVVGALREAGVRSIVLKGPPLVRWLYEDDASRSSSDVDLLVAPDALPAGEAALRRLGFAPLATGIGAADRPRHAATWRRRRLDVCIDLHTTLVGLGVPAAEAWGVLAGETEPISVGVSEVGVLAPGARALHVVLHAAQHGAREQQPLDDLARALEMLALPVWQEAAALAVRLEATAAFAAGLALLSRGRDLLGQLELPIERSVEAALRAGTAPPLALGFEWLARAPGLRWKAAFAVRKVVPPAAFMRIWSPLARRNRAGLAAAYVWRPVWLLLRTGPAVRAWRRARRVSRA